MSRLAVSILFALVLPACATERSLDRTLRALDKTADNASIAEAGIAAVATHTSELLVEIRETVHGARMSIDHERVMLDRTIAPIPSATAALSRALENVAARTEQPLIAPQDRAIIYAFAAGLLALLGVSIWNHLHLRRLHRHVSGARASTPSP